MLSPPCAYFTTPSPFAAPNLNYTRDRIAEQIKGITHRLGTASGEAEQTLA